MARNPPWTVEHKARNAHYVELQATSKTDEWRFLLSSCRHHDNPHCNQDLERVHLEECVESGAGVIDCGDLFCAMQGKYDRRSSKADLRPEHACADDYLDSLVRTASEFYAPYARNMIVLGQGNHETAILKNHETCLTTRLVERLRASSATTVAAGGYRGWVKFSVRFGTERYGMLLHHFHGAGGAAPMTRGTLGIVRAAAWIPDADVLMEGHTHKQWHMAYPRIRFRSDSGKPRTETDHQYHVRCGTYKDEFGDGHNGWHVEQGRGPETIGAVWMTLRLVKTTKQRETRYQLEPSFTPTSQGVSHGPSDRDSVAGPDGGRGGGRGRGGNARADFPSDGVDS